MDKPADFRFDYLIDSLYPFAKRWDFSSIEFDNEQCEQKDGAGGIVATTTTAVVLTIKVKVVL